MKRIWHGLILVFLTSCSKTEVGSGTYNGDFTLTGTVRDEISGKPIPFATAMIMRKHRDANWGGMSVLEKTQSDSLGQFVLSFYADTRDYVYSLDANALTYFDKNLNGSDKINFSKDQIIQQDVVLMPQAYLTSIVKGNKGGWKISSSFVGGGGLSFFAGVDTVVNAYAIPNQEVKFNYFVYFQDTSKNYKKVVVLPPPSPHDTTYYLIEF